MLCLPLKSAEKLATVTNTSPLISTGKVSKATIFPSTSLQDKCEEDLLPECHEMIRQQGKAVEPLKFDPQLFTCSPPGDILNTPDSRLLSTSFKAIKAKQDSQ